MVKFNYIFVIKEFNYIFMNITIFTISKKELELNYFEVRL